MPATANAHNHCPLTRWIPGGLMRLLSRHLAAPAKHASRLTGILGICLIGLSGISISGAVGLPGFLTPRKTIALHGGTEFTLRIQPREDENGAKIPITQLQVSQVITVLKKRLKALGNRDAQVTPKGDDGILVQVPAAAPDESKSIREILKVCGQLKLLEANPRSDEVGPDGKTLAARVIANEEIVPGYRAFTYKRKDADGNEIAIPILLNRRTALGSNDIALAQPCPQQPGAIAITLNKAGTEKMIALTKDMIPQKARIGIVLDGIVISAPVVNQVPLGKNFIIEGPGGPGEVNGLVAALMNPLETPVVIEAERTVAPPNDPKK